jgi:hypothetical protein
MKTALLAAAIGFALAPIIHAPMAHAQAVCSDVPKLVDYALDDFDDIIDEEVSDDLYSTTEMLANAAECGVSYEFDSVYACMWIYDNAAAAGAAYNAQVSALAPCLASGWTPATPVMGNPANGLTPLSKAVYDGEDDNTDLEWTVMMEEHQQDGIHDWHVWVALSYLW